MQCSMPCGASSWTGVCGWDRAAALGEVALPRCELLGGAGGSLRGGVAGVGGEAADGVILLLAGLPWVK